MTHPLPLHLRNSTAQQYSTMQQHAFLGTGGDVSSPAGSTQQYSTVPAGHTQHHTTSQVLEMQSHLLHQCAGLVCMDLAQLCVSRHIKSDVAHIHIILLGTVRHQAHARQCCRGMMEETMTFGNRGGQGEKTVREKMGGGRDRGGVYTICTHLYWHRAA